MMEYKVAELEGTLLDAAVAKAEGWSAAEVAAMVSDPEGADRYLAASTSWGIAGPIIERELIIVLPPGRDKVDQRWIAGSDYDYEGEVFGRQEAKTPLVAAMRVYVAMKHGETIELP